MLELRKFATNDITSSLCMRIYSIEKREILYAFNAAASSCRRASFLQLFKKFVQSPQFPPFTQKVLTKFFLLHKL